MFGQFYNNITFLVFCPIEWAIQHKTTIHNAIAAQNGVRFSQHSFHTARLANTGTPKWTTKYLKSCLTDTFFMYAFCYLMRNLLRKNDYMCRCDANDRRNSFAATKRTWSSLYDLIFHLLVQTNFTVTQFDSIKFD